MGDPKKPTAQFLSEGQPAWNPGRAMVSIQIQRQGKENMPQFEGSQAGGTASYLGEDQPICSLQAFN